MKSEAFTQELGLNGLRETTLKDIEVYITYTAERSSGPGGQNVNKTSSKVRLRFDLAACPRFTQEEKSHILAVAGNKATTHGEIIIEEEGERSQHQNKETVNQRLLDLIITALTPDKERIPTHPTRASRERRKEEKVHQGIKKANRSRRPHTEEKE